MNGKDFRKNFIDLLGNSHEPGRTGFLTLPEVFFRADHRLAMEKHRIHHQPERVIADALDTQGTAPGGSGCSCGCLPG